MMLSCSSQLTEYDETLFLVYRCLGIVGHARCVHVMAGVGCHFVRSFQALLVVALCTQQLLIQLPLSTLLRD